MAKHHYRLTVDGGYYYRFYPILPSPMKRVKGPQPSLFDDELDDNPEPEAVDPNRDSFHGIFIRKDILKGRHVIAILAVASFILQDAITNETESRMLQSTILIEVPESIYNYPFQEKKSYIITLTDVYELL